MLCQSQERRDEEWYTESITEGGGTYAAGLDVEPGISYFGVAKIAAIEHNHGTGNLD